jgi:hypothetical protein
MKKSQAAALVIALAAVFVFLTPACFGQSGGGGSINSARALMEYLDSQPANSPDKPIMVTMSVNDLMIKEVENVLTSAGKYVSLNLSGSPLTKIPGGAFRGCKALVGLTIPNNVTTIGEDAFRNYTNLISVTIPNSVTTIGSNAFSGCSGLAGVTIPNSVTTIEWGAFSGCSGLASVTIGNSVTTIGQQAFGGCTNLKNITIKTDKVTNDQNNNWLTRFPAAGLSVTFEDLKSIGDYAFCFYYSDSASSTRLTSVTIPNSVTTIGSNAFQRCTGLAGVTIPDSVTTIGSSAFSGCSGLTSVTIGSGVTSIGDSVFSGCSGLASVTIPNSVTTIGNYAFRGCTSLTGVTIPNSVTTIEGGAFSGCFGLTNVTIGNGVTSIGGIAFYDCTRLVSVTFATGSNIPNANFGDNAFPEGGDGPNYRDRGNTLRTAYSVGKVGTYMRPANGNTWMKQ